MPNDETVIDYFKKRGFFLNLNVQRMTQYGVTSIFIKKNCNSRIGLKFPTAFSNSRYISFTCGHKGWQEGSISIM